MRLIVRAYQQTDAEGISAFIKGRFLKDVSNPVRSHEPEYYRWKYAPLPWGKPAVFVADHEGKIAGFFAILPRRFKAGGRVMIVGETCDAYVDPAFQGSGVFFKLVASAFQSMREQGIGSFYTTANALTLPIWTGPFRFRRAFCYYNLVRPIRFGSIFVKKTGKFLSALIGWKFSLIYKIFFPIPKLPAQIRWQRVHTGQELTGVWESAGDTHPVTLVKDAEYLSHRFFSGPEEYLVFKASLDNRVLGYSVMKETLYRGMKCGHIVDLVVARGDDRNLRHVLAKSLDVLRESGCVLVSSWAARRTPLYRTLRNQGFWARRKEFHLLLGGGWAESGQENLFEISNWWYAHGDSDNV